MRKRIYETELLEILGMTRKETGCCCSCHEDHDMGYDLIEFEMKDGTLVEVCCDVYRAVKHLDIDPV